MLKSKRTRLSYRRPNAHTAFRFTEGEVRTLRLIASMPTKALRGGEPVADNDVFACTCSGNCGSNYSVTGGCTCSGNCGSNYSKGAIESTSRMQIIRSL